jgi:hypothetical protein
MSERRIRPGRFLALALLLSAAARAEPYAVGSTLEPLEFADQHDQIRTVDALLRALLFTRDMQAGDVLKQALAEDGAAQLERAGAVYVADVSGMPALVLRMFALPKLRQRPYPILLDRDGSQTARLPSQSGKVSLLVLDALRVKEIRYLANPEEIRAALAASGN